MGRTLVTSGLIVLLFAGFQLWGTDAIAAGEQRQLSARFDERLAGTAGGGIERSPSRSARDDSPAVGTRPAPAVGRGEPVARLAIPRIGLDQVVVQGVGVRDLRKGPGHYPETPMPGHTGNVALAGHRTTYGAPFFRLDELERGDEIRVRTPEGRFRYLVTGTRVVDPGDVSVLSPTGGATLTLTTCHPRYSARERLVVRARLVGQPVEPPPDERVLAAALATLAVRTDSAPAALGAVEGVGAKGAAALALPFVVGGAWWWAWRRWRRWTTWVVGCALFLPALLPAFVQVEYLIPTGV